MRHVMFSEKTDLMIMLSIGSVAAAAGGLFLLLLPICRETFGLVGSAVFGTVMLGIGVLVAALVVQMWRAPEGRATKRLRALLLVGFCGASSVGLVVGPLAMCIDCWQLSRNGREAVATVIDVRATGGKSQTYQLTVLVGTTDRRVIEHTTKFKRGRKLGLLIDPKDDRRAIVGHRGDGFLALAGHRMGLGTLVMMLVFGVSGLGLTLSQWRVLLGRTED